MSKLTSILSAALLLACGPSIAAEGMYVVAAGGVSDTEFEDASEEGASYKLGVGYQFDRQWYAEFGYQKLVDESLNTNLPTSVDAAADWSGGLEIDALYASVLGKASSQSGELFYRVGVLMTDTRGQQLAEPDGCPVGAATPVQIGSSPYALCQFDEGGVAGVFGIGFDFYLGVSTMLRTEIEYIGGENGLQTTAAYIGLRYNFL